MKQFLAKHFNTPRDWFKDPPNPFADLPKASEAPSRVDILEWNKNFRLSLLVFVIVSLTAAFAPESAKSAVGSIAIVALFALFAFWTIHAMKRAVELAPELPVRIPGKPYMNLATMRYHVTVIVLSFTFTISTGIAAFTAFDGDVAEFTTMAAIGLATFMILFTWVLVLHLTKADDSVESLNQRDASAIAFVLVVLLSVVVGPIFLGDRYFNKISYSHLMILGLAALYAVPYLILRKVRS